MVVVASIVTGSRVVRGGWWGSECYRGGRAKYLNTAFSAERSWRAMSLGSILGIFIDLTYKSASALNLWTLYHPSHTQRDVSGRLDFDY